MKKPQLLLVIALCSLTALSSGGLTPQLLAQTSVQAHDPEMKHYKSSEWNFELDVPKSWNRFPPVSSNSPFEVTRFASDDESGHHGLIIFRFPYDPKTGLQAIREGAQQTLTKAGFSNFVQAETKIGSKVVLTLDFDSTVNGSAVHARYYYFADGTLRYTLAFVNREAMVALDDRIAKTFVTNN